ncbi:hypothetical protein F2Q69_00024861 [Brassica cretica]|uniref:Uncharacterized protein n=1 Tax=Brassica cretica TaxID=69181 RepID=A0A8S9QG56_BRACR|nr:hypothetical protein F2Q69_00024861 [Brassica cretica]
MRTREARIYCVVWRCSLGLWSFSSSSFSPRLLRLKQGRPLPRDSLELEKKTRATMNAPLDSLQVMYGNSDDFFFAYESHGGHQHPEANGSHQREDEFSSLVEIKEYADCSQGSIPQVLKKRELVYLLSVGYMRNHNTVGGLGEEALFPGYWNEYNWPVLTAESPETVTDHLELPYYNKVRYLLLESGAEEGINPLGFFASHADLKVPGICILQSLFTGEDDTWKSWLSVVMPALINLRQFSKIFWN